MLALLMRAVNATALALGLEVITREIRQMDDIASAIEALNGRADAIYVANDRLVFDNRVQIKILAQDAGLPTIYGFVNMLGRSTSYGPNWTDLFRLPARRWIDKILRGAKPADILVEQPTKFDLIINLGTAMALGLTIPATLLARADEVIE